MKGDYGGHAERRHRRRLSGSSYRSQSHDSSEHTKRSGSPYSSDGEDRRRSKKIKKLRNTKGKDDKAQDLDKSVH